MGLRPLFSCGLALDGFDLTITGVALPKIKDSLNASSGALGIADGAGLIGPLVVAIFFGMSADRWGRKRMLYKSASGTPLLGYSSPRVS